MPTLVRITGFEHGVLGVNGSGLFSGITGTELAIQSTVKHSGTYGLRFNLTAATQTRVTYAISTQTLVGRFYLYVHAFPTGGAAQILYNYISGGITNALYLEVSGGSNRIYAQCTGGTIQYGPTLSIDTWCAIDFQFYSGGATYTIDWKVDGAAQAQASVGSGTPTTVTSLSMGNNARVGDWTFDDLVLSYTSGDFPLTHTAVLGIKPGSDGTHNAGTNTMEDQAGNDIGVVTAYDKLNSVPIGNITTYVKQSTLDTAKYAQVNFEDTTETNIIGAMAILAYQSASTASNQGAAIVIDEDATQTTIWGNPTTRQDYSESSPFYKSVILPIPAGTWDMAAVNALKANIGYSGDVSPVPYWLDLFIEVAYGPSGSTFNDDVSLARSAGVIEGNDAILAGAMSLARSAGISSPGELLAYESLIFNRSMGISSPGELIGYESMILARSMGISLAGGLDLSDAVILGRSLGITTGNILEAAAQISLGKILGITVLADLWLYSMMNLAKYLGIDQLGELTSYESLGLAKSLGITFTGGMNISDGISLERALGIASINAINLQEAISLARGMGINEIGSLAIETVLSLSRWLGISTDGAVVIGGVPTVFIYLTLAERSNSLTLEERSRLLELFERSRSLTLEEH